MVCGVVYLFLRFVMHMQIVRGRCGENFARTQKFTSMELSLLNRRCCNIELKDHVRCKHISELRQPGNHSIVSFQVLTGNHELSIQLLSANARVSFISVLLAYNNGINLLDGVVATKRYEADLPPLSAKTTCSQRMYLAVLRWKALSWSSVELASEYKLSVVSEQVGSYDVAGSSNMYSTISYGKSFLHVDAESLWPHQIGGRGRVGRLARFVQHPLFGFFIMLVILMNAIVMAVSREGQNVYKEGGNFSPKTMFAYEIMFSAIYTIEMILKLIALEGPKGYLLDGWNILDGFVVLVGWAAVGVAALPDSLVTLRVLRMLRMLRSIRFFSGARQFVDTTFATFPLALKTIFIYMAFILIFAAVSVDIFGGALNFQCVVVDAVPRNPFSGPLSRFPSGYAPDGHGSLLLPCANHPSCDSDGHNLMTFRPILDHRYCGAAEPFGVPPVNGSTLLDTVKVNDGYGISPSWFEPKGMVKTYFSEVSNHSAYWNPTSERGCPAASYCAGTQSPNGGYMGFHTLYAAFMTIFLLGLRTANNSWHWTGLISATGTASVLYMVAVIILIGFLVLSLFVSIVTSAYLDVKADFLASWPPAKTIPLIPSWESTLANKHKKSPRSCRIRGIEKGLKKRKYHICYLFRPGGAFAERISSMIWSSTFEYVVSATIFLNTVISSSRYAGMPTYWAFIITWSEIFFAVFFLCEMILKIIGLWGIRNYLFGIRNSTFFLSISRYSRDVQELKSRDGSSSIADGVVVWEPVRIRKLPSMMCETEIGEILPGVSARMSSSRQVGLNTISRWNYDAFKGMKLSNALDVSSNEELSHALPNKSGPGSKLSARWHILESILVVVSIVTAIDDLTSPSWAGYPENLGKDDNVSAGSFQPTFFRVLRILRLLRLLTVFKFSSTMAQIWKAMELAIQEIGDLTIVLVLIMCTYAMIGMQLLGSGTAFSDEADPLLNFDTFGNALLTLFRALTRGGFFPINLRTSHSEVTDGSMQDAKFEADDMNRISGLTNVLVIVYYFSYIFVVSFITLNILAVIVISKFALQGFEKHCRRAEYASTRLDRFVHNYKKLMLRRTKCTDLTEPSTRPVDRQGEDPRYDSTTGLLDRAFAIVPGIMPRLGRPDASDSDSETEEAYQSTANDNKIRIQHLVNKMTSAVHRRQILGDMAFSIQHRVTTGQWLKKQTSNTLPTVKNEYPYGVSSVQTYSSALGDDYRLLLSNNFIVMAKMTVAHDLLYLPNASILATVKRIFSLERRIKTEKKVKIATRLSHSKHTGNPKLSLCKDRGQSCFCISQPDTSTLRSTCMRIVYSRWFENIILLMIILSSILLAADNPRGNESRASNIAEFVITMIFVLEAVLRSVADGFVLGKKAYLKNPWNRLDFCVVFVSVVGFIADWSIAGEVFPSREETDVNSSSSIVTVARLLRIARILRPLRMISRNEGLRVVTSTIFFSVPGVILTMTLLIVVFLVFAVGGITFFGGQFKFCSDDTVSQRSECEGIFENSETGLLSHRKWENPPFHFDHIGAALATLFEVSTLRNWPMVLNAATGIQGVDKQPRPGAKPWLSVYFVTFIFIASLFISFFFIGVIVGAFRQLRGTGLLSTQQNRYYRFALLLRTVQVPIAPPQHWFRRLFFDMLMYRPVSAQEQKLRQHTRSTCSLSDEEPGSKTRTSRDTFPGKATMVGGVENVITSIAQKTKPQNFSDSGTWDTVFERIVTAVVYIHTAIVIIAQMVYGSTFDEQSSLIALFWVFNSLYILEFSLRLIGFGASRWLIRDGVWMLWDIMVVLISVGAGFSGLSWHTMSIARALRFDRVVKHFRHQMTGIQLLLRVMYYAMPMLWSVTLLVLLVNFVYAILGVQLFGHIKHGKFLRSNYNFGNFWNSMFILLNILSGEDWILLMHDCGASSPICTTGHKMDEAWGASTDCGSLVLSTIYFYSFYIIQFMVFLNLYVAAIVDTYVTLQPLGPADIQRSKRKTLGYSEEHGLTLTNELELTEAEQLGDSLSKDMATLLGEIINSEHDAARERDFKLMAPADLFVPGYKLHAVDVEAFRVLWKRFDVTGSGYVYSNQLPYLLITMWLVGHPLICHPVDGCHPFAATQIEKARLRILMNHNKNSSIIESFFSLLDDKARSIAELASRLICKRSTRKTRLVQVSPNQTTLQAKTVAAFNNSDAQSSIGSVAKMKTHTMKKAEQNSSMTNPDRMASYPAPSRIQFSHALNALVYPYIRKSCLMEHERLIRMLEERGVATEVAAMNIQRWYKDIQH